LVHAHNLSVIASFGLQPYTFNRPSDLQQQLNDLHTDFTKFINSHKKHPAISMWCLGDVEDYVFKVETDIAEYP
jgi:hypothetical protein